MRSSPVRCRRGWQPGSHSEKSVILVHKSSVATTVWTVSQQFRQGQYSSGWPFSSSWGRREEGRKAGRLHSGALSFHSWIQPSLDSYSLQGPEEESRVETRPAALHQVCGGSHPGGAESSQGSSQDTSYVFPAAALKSAGPSGLRQRRQVSTSGELLSVSCTSDFKQRESQDRSHVSRIWRVPVNLQLCSLQALGQHPS